MDVKSVVERSGKETVNIKRWSQVLHASKWTELSICFGLGLVLSAAKIGLNCAPFGLAMLAVLGFGSGGFVCLIGAVAGYFAAFGFTIGTQMAAGCVLTFASLYFMRNSRFVFSAWTPPVVSMAAYGMTRLTVLAFTGGFSLLIAVHVLLQLMICGGSALAFQTALSLREIQTANSAIGSCVSTILLLSCLMSDPGAAYRL